MTDYRKTRISRSDAGAVRGALCAEIAKTRELQKALQAQQLRLEALLAFVDDLMTVESLERWRRGSRPKVEVPSSSPPT